MSSQVNTVNQVDGDINLSQEQIDLMYDRFGYTARDGKEQSKSPEAKHHVSLRKGQDRAHKRKTSTQRDDQVPKQRLILKRKSISKKSLNPSNSGSLPKFLQEFDEKLNTQRVTR